MQVSSFADTVANTLAFMLLLKCKQMLCSCATTATY